MSFRSPGLFIPAPECPARAGPACEARTASHCIRSLNPAEPSDSHLCSALAWGRLAGVDRRRAGPSEPTLVCVLESPLSSPISNHPQAPPRIFGPPAQRRPGLSRLQGQILSASPGGRLQHPRETASPCMCPAPSLCRRFLSQDILGLLPSAWSPSFLAGIGLVDAFFFFFSKASSKQGLIFSCPFLLSWFCGLLAL